MQINWICRRCGDRPDPAAGFELGKHDCGVAGGMGPCGDLHDWRVDYDLVVTRHSGLVTHLRRIGEIGADTPVAAHVLAADVRDRHVIGHLPLELAAQAASITEIPLDVTPEWRGMELSADAIQRIASPPRTYVVNLAAIRSAM